MAITFVLMGVIWFGGPILRLPKAVRALLVGLIYVLGFVVLLTLPEGHNMRELFGDSVGIWALVGMCGAVVGLYVWALPLLRKRGETAAGVVPEAGGSFSETELDRYARHIVLREVGGLGQKRLREARVLVIGAGGLGAPALQYLGAAGVGTIGVVDDDVVENANLQRQVIHKDAAIGTPKVFSAQSELQAQNPFISVRPYHRRLDQESAEALFAEYDLILDGTDNFDTRYMVNRVAVALGKPLISAAMTQWEGQISLYDPAHGGPCYQCVFPEPPAPGLVPSCSEAGVIGPLPGVMGSMMAVEAIKVITGAGENLRGVLFTYDALYGETRKFTTSKRADCPVCGAIQVRA
ncbi:MULTISPECIES: HesA/MoeB/ThiF family protein [Halocynthiibacter]|uniref:Molybdopterin-synthase adenylyltransferase n=1 Tax=Halocynthiibacter halioticoli TaxID=2986804 RepID=A0AAE3IWR7_9RHOB|nr:MULTISPECIES: HesA/MoeB/ThiF family protein [Halocynthiibacter]MCV6823642.1 HesA/MoeB/ThiF family protein [Halocynthiibacter halioticoli]MCW4056643.1 HesA/MoeB/ThiF family protein [Halocynthiibacter sp. SDUM655004]